MVRHRIYLNADEMPEMPEGGEGGDGWVKAGDGRGWVGMGGEGNVQLKK